MPTDMFRYPCSSIATSGHEEVLLLLLLLLLLVSSM